MEEAEPVEESTEEAGGHRNTFLSQEESENGPCWFLNASHLNENLIPISNE